jgi:MYXO-CTERM domain-containing protein
VGNHSRGGLGAAVVFVSVVVASCLSSPRLSSSVQPVVTVSASSYYFGTLPLGQGSNSPSFTVSPAGSADDDFITKIDFAQSCPDFALNLSPPLGSGSGSAHVFNDCALPAFGTASGATPCTPVTYTFNTTFTPHSAGSQSCNVRILTVSGSGSGSGSAAGTQTIMLSGSGMAPSYLMDVSPPSIDFADVPTGSSSGPQIVKVQNTGSTQISVMGSNNAAGTFTVSPSLGTSTLNVGATQTYSVVCTPTVNQIYNGTLTFTTSAVQGSLVGTTTLTCRGVTTTLAVTPNPIDYGALLIGHAAVVKSVTIQNGSGSPSVTLSNFRFTGSASTDLAFPGGAPGSLSIGSGVSAMIMVAYAATIEQAPGALGTLTFDVNGSALNVPITGGAQLGSIGTNPASVDFGPICAGGSASQDIKVFANAAGTVRLMSKMDPASPFSVTGGALPVDLLGHHMNEVTLTAGVQTSVPGDLNGMLSLATDIPSSMPRLVTLAAHVLPAGITPTPNAIRFGAVGVGMASPAKQVVLTTCSASPLTVSATHIDGTDSNDFVAAAVDPMVLQPMQSEMFLVLMSPHSNGPKMATFVIQHDRGPAVVAIDGTGFAGADPGTPSDRETYYACSTGEPAAMLPIVFALLALRRRRK